MKLLFLVLTSIILVSCGQPRWESPNYDPYFQDEWRRNDTVRKNGSKLTKNATLFVMPQTTEVDASLVVTVPLNEFISDCYKGRILSKDTHRYLDYNYYEVLDCYENIDNRNFVDIVLKFNRTTAQEVYFDYHL